MKSWHVINLLDFRQMDALHYIINNENADTLYVYNLLTCKWAAEAAHAHKECLLLAERHRNVPYSTAILLCHWKVLPTRLSSAIRIKNCETTHDTIIDIFDSFLFGRYSLTCVRPALSSFLLSFFLNSIQFNGLFHIKFST